ncbi:MAG: glycosyltransferase [Paracoccaceae bacterium]
MKKPVQFDILYIADFRTGDTGAASAVNALNALSGAGYRIAVLPWFGAARADPTLLESGFDDVLSNHVRLVSFDAQFSCSLILANDLRLFKNRAAEPLNIDAPLRIVVCTRGVAARLRNLHADVANAQEALGGPIILAPAAAPIRAALQALMPSGHYTNVDWPPTLEPLVSVDAPRRAERVSLPMLGYYRCAQSRLWPDSLDALRDVLPDHPLLGLTVLGAADKYVDLLRNGSAPVFFEDPENCTIGQFLDQLDALSINADANDEPWPAEILAAVAHGTIPILSPEFRGIFMESAIYARPKYFADTVVDLFSSAVLMDDLRNAGRELIEQVLAPRHLISRVTAQIGPPATVSAPISSKKLRPPGNIISVSTNGIGMGHLARQMAIGKRLGSHLSPVFLGFSQSIAVVRQFGWMSEYLPYHRGPDMNTGYWNEWLVKALDAACRFYKPRALVLDANVPFEAFGALRDLRPGLPMIWVRRAFWGPGRDLAALQRAPWFDTVIEPGEYAAPYDSGPTTQVRSTVREVPPIHFVDRRLMLSRKDAATELGIDPDTQNVLLMPGAMNNFGAASLWKAIAATLSQWPNTGVVAAEWAITEHPMDWPASVARRRGFPYARWFNAFDFAVSAAGYNSFAELIGLGLPTIFVPNENALMDRQDLRALFAERNGLGLRLTADGIHNVQDTLEKMRNPAFRQMVRAKLHELSRSVRSNGASDAADIVTYLADAGRSHRSNVWL